jgi:hypothetical protein
MHRLEAGADIRDDARLASDVQKLICAVADWAGQRPILADVTLFGERLRAGHHGLAPVQIAVRYDDRRMLDGFDDWIEQLRTNFADLTARLSEPVTVLTPDRKAEWNLATQGREIPVLSTDKVRLVLNEPVRLPSQSTAPPRHSKWFQALRGAWPMMSEPLTLGRR